MPDPFERHSRPNGCCDDRVSQPSRSQMRRMATADDGEPRQAPARKDRVLCKATHWKRSHKPEIRAAKDGFMARRDCRWGTSRADPDEPSWHCFHEEVCAGCGKVLRISVEPGECPDFHPITGAERAAVEADITRRRDLIAQQNARRPVISGPQGYRKRKGAC